MRLGRLHCSGRSGENHPHRGNVPNRPFRLRKRGSMRNCTICGEPFFPMATTSKYCSARCRSKANNDARKQQKQEWYLNSVGRKELIIRTTKGRWIHSKTGYVMIKVKGELVYEHRHLAEKALGKPLPFGAIVHHTQTRDDNHGQFKLVICPNQEYHMLLHKRAKELGYENH